MFYLEEGEIIKRKKDNRDILLNIGYIYFFKFLSFDNFIRYIFLCIVKRFDCNMRINEFCEFLLLM